MVGKGLSPLLCLSLGVEPGKALAASMSSFGSKPVIPILRLLSGSLCLWRERFPGPVRDASVLPPSPAPIIRSVWLTPSRGLQQQQRQQQHRPGQWEEAGGSTVTDAVENLCVWIICKASGPVPPR